MASGGDRLQIVSIGYERRSAEELISILSENGVTTLVDVRESAMSRKAEFRKSALSKLLVDAGIAYVHLSIAGNPFRAEKQDIERCLSLYSDYLEDNPKIVDSIVKSLPDQPLAFLCYERPHGNCHRSVLLEEMRRRGVDVDLIKVE